MAEHPFSFSSAPGSRPRVELTIQPIGDDRPFLLLHATRTPDVAAFRQDLERLTDALDLRVVHVVEDAPASWEGASGRIDEALLERHLPDARADLHCFLCGPKPMQATVESLLQEAGVGLSRIHSEVFHWV